MSAFAYEDRAFAGVTEDSRRVQPGFLFVARPGVKFPDPAPFIDQALEKGAAGVLTFSDVTPLPDLPDGMPLFIRDDPPMQVMVELAVLAYPNIQTQIAAVTGTNGKTSVAHFVRQLLGERCISVGTLGLQPAITSGPQGLTTPDPLSLFASLAEARTQGRDQLVIEASSQGLAQGRLEGLSVDAALFTNLTRDHIGGPDGHADMDDYGQAKMGLFERLLKPSGIAIFNADDPFCAAQSMPQSTWSYGHAGRQLRLIDRTASAGGQRLTLELFGDRHELFLPLIGAFQADNLLAAIGLAHALGAPIERLVKRAADLTSVPGRMESVTTPNGQRTVLVDYAHTPDALKTVLESARPHCPGKLTVLFGAGGDRDASKRPEMGTFAAQLADVAYVVDDNPRSEDPATIRANILRGNPGLVELGERRAGIEAALTRMNDGDCLVIAGKGHEDYQEINGVKHPFDDCAIASELAAELWS